MLEAYIQDFKKEAKLKELSQENIDMIIDTVKNEEGHILLAPEETFKWLDNNSHPDVHSVLGRVRALKLNFGYKEPTWIV